MMQDDAKPVAWQRRQQYSDIPGYVPQWQFVSKEEATGHFEKRPGYEYRPVYAHPPAPAQPADVERVALNMLNESQRFMGLRLYASFSDVPEHIMRDWLRYARAALAAMPVGDGFSKEWCIRMAQLEAGHEIGAGAPDHPLRCPPVVDGPPYASDNWDIQGYKSPAEEIDDMANVGRSLIERIASVRESDGPFKGWAPMDDPAEIVTDMANWIAENRATPPADADAGLVGLEKWARDLSALNHRLAHENKDLRTEHIALSTAYREVAERLAALGQGGVR